MRTRPPSVAVERAALAIGLASSLSLAVAVFAAFGDSRSAGWSRLDDLASRARSNVREAWDALTRVDPERAAFLEPASDVVQLGPEPELAPPPQPLPAGDLGPLHLFDVLFEESQRAELSKNDLAEALSLAVEAAEKDAPPAQIAQARLRAIQLAVRQGNETAAREQWDAARASTEPRIVTGDTSTLLLCALAAAGALPEEGRRAALEPLMTSWTSNGLVLPDAARGYERAEPGGKFEWSRSLRELALRERLLELAGRPAEWTARFDAFDRAARRAAFGELAGPLPASALSPTVWALQPAAGELVALRADAENQVQAHLVLRATIEPALAALVEERRALPDGFALDLAGDSAERGEMVGPWIDLGPAFPRAALRHPDVPSILREVESRALLLRAGLLVLALFVAGAAVATFLALRRERRLSEARTAFVASVSHELRTPLASILLMAENLQAGKAGENAARYHAHLKREAQRLRRLVDDVLDFSRLERGQRLAAHADDVELAPWFDALAADAEELAAQAKVAVRAVRDPGLVRATFDREAVRRAVLNLVDNAVRHSGTEEIELELRLRDPATLALSVSDRGHGIERRHRESVFEPFTRLNGSQANPGAGLGLAIVKEIAEVHGGSVVVREREGGPGAVFELALPLKGPAEVKP